MKNYTAFLLCLWGALLSGCAESLGTRIDPETQTYEVSFPSTGYKFSGRINAPVQKVDQQNGADKLGAYSETTFEFTQNGVPLVASIKMYPTLQAAMFTLTYKAASAKPVAAFPDFSGIPQNLSVFSYKPENFAPPTFTPQQGGSPWLLFDDKDNAAIISPASHFLVQQIDGDAKTRIAGECLPKLTNIPAGFKQQTLMIAGRGINATWEAWGQTISTLQASPRPPADADIGLKYLGYWTDNGAYYYYNYDTSLGYEGTLLKLADQFREAHIPVRYLQLDSWWYSKTLTGPDGKLGKTKNDKLPEGEWNRYGGLLEYRAHPFVFPDGLAGFQHKLGMALVTHNRWIDPASPYHQRYKFDGLVCIDRNWWDDIAEYLQHGGVVTYEQDWLNKMFQYTPDLSANAATGEQFLDSMAAACSSHNVTMQYCMAMPAFYLQGSRYPNLTTIRVSDDRFGPSRWQNFFYTSRLASALGIYPWTDVYNSTESKNLLLSVLSEGMVGFGDAMGKENRDNLMKAVRGDGLIVKPDVPITPLDSTYIATAAGEKTPLVAATRTDHAGLKTGYVFADGSASQAVHISPKELGIRGDLYVYNPFDKSSVRISDGDAFDGMLNQYGVGYYVFVPVGKSGIAFLGDAGKYVGTGKQRIGEMQDDHGGLSAVVAFAAGEDAVTLHGFAASAPTVSVPDGDFEALQYDADSHYFSVKIIPPPGGPSNVSVILSRH